MGWRRLFLVMNLVVLASGCPKDAPKTPAATSAVTRVDEVVAAPEKLLAAEKITVHGFVVPGSITSEIVDQQSVRTFQLTEKNAKIEVRHTGVVSDLFKDHAELTVTGKLSRENGELLLVTIGGEQGMAAIAPTP